MDSRMTDGRSDIEVVMIVRDEEANLPFSLPAIVPWVRKVWVVDSGSTDRTVEIAREAGAEPVYHEWQGYAKQKNWALDSLPLSASWILFLDADERITPDLADRIRSIVDAEVADVAESAFHLNRYFVFLGGQIRHCGYYPSWNVRLFKRGRARYEPRDVHEHMVVDGPVGFIHGADMEHWDRRPLEHHIAKHNRYSTLEALAIRAQEHGGASEGLRARLFGGPLERRRWIKRYLYPRLPAKFVFRFLWMYVLQRGFLDGAPGLRFSLFISAYELHIEQKLIELRQASST
jgi:glycosyltransferase involved in cell wall biosynthesis